MMQKTTTTTKEYDKDGNLTKETTVVTEAPEGQPLHIPPPHYYNPAYAPHYVPEWVYRPTITCGGQPAVSKVGGWASSSAASSGGGVA